MTIHPEKQTESATAGINMPKIVAVGVSSLLIFAIASWIAYAVLRADTNAIRALGDARPTPEVGRPEIGIVDTPVFDDDFRLQEWQALMGARLNRFEWINRAQGAVRLPISVAMRKVVEEHARAVDRPPVPVEQRAGIHDTEEPPAIEETIEEAAEERPTVRPVMPEGGGPIRGPAKPPGMTAPQEGNAQ